MAKLLTDRGLIEVRGAVRVDLVDGAEHRAVLAELAAADRRCAQLEREIARLRCELARLAVGTYRRAATG